MRASVSGRADAEGPLDREGCGEDEPEGESCHAEAIVAPLRYGGAEVQEQAKPEGADTEQGAEQEDRPV